VTSVAAAPGFDEDELLRLAAGVERASEHPLAASILAAAKELRVAPSHSSAFQSVAGKGAMASVAGKRIALGNRALMNDLGVNLDALQSQAAALESKAQTVVFVAVDTSVAGCIAIADAIRASAKDAVTQLHASGIGVVMATGDNRATAQAVARELGIEEIHAEISPAQKRAIVAALQKQGRTVAVAGDGVNDAPALAQADVGIAMATGTDVAAESAAITLLHGDLRGIARARKLSHATMRNIRQNLLFAFLYNSLGVPVAAGILYPFFGLLLSPVIASAAMTLSSVSVIANALRLRHLQL